jgi:trans-aconitate methyltransferase
MVHGNLHYWLSRESLYWHFWRQTDTTPEPLQMLVERIPALSDPSLTALELGFGIGKNRYFHPKLFPFRKYIGVEANPYCVDVARQRMPDVEVVCALNNAVGNIKADVLFVFGGVLMYQSPEEVDSLFRSLKDLKALVILGEGADSDWVREDQTIMYDFRSRLQDNGYAGRSFLIEKQHDSPINRLFAMW